MFKPFSSIFHFLSPGRTGQCFQPRKPMAIPVATDAHNIQLCKKLFTQLDDAEAEILNDINDPEKAWQLLSKIRQLRRESQQEFAILLPAGSIAIISDNETALNPVRTVMTRTGFQWTIFNGGRSG
ncbi:hypothetical protein [Methylobacter sp. S3L5C]|uniref:hypothetical protein n=1 Tax=Methylobacter sp. S3L5C TaxID=2839024 RepID=UPI001FAB8BBA|nr:hypothetical protein [Methylobacter sp. S3L5C]UOA07338.1 hypothetical protein KKZ03_13740 [Methylobacter sp. S3L5C]